MLQLTLDQLNGVFRSWSGAAVGGAILRWPAIFDLRLKFALGPGVVEQLGEAAAGEVEIRRAPDGLLLARVPGWERVGAGAAAHYALRIALSTAPLNPLFAADPTLGAIPARLEVRWLRGDGTDERSLALPVTIERAGNEGDDPVVTVLPSRLAPYEAASEAARLALDPASPTAPLRFGQTVRQGDTGGIWQWVATDPLASNQPASWQPWTGPTGATGPQGLPGAGALEATEAESRDPGVASAWISPRRLYARGDVRWSPLGAELAAAALDFAGSVGATFAAPVPAVGPGDFTLAAWVSPATVAGQHRIISGGTHSAALDISDGAIRLLDENFSLAVASGVVLADGQAAHIAVTRIGLGIAIYLNGLQVAAGSTSVDFFNAWESVGARPGGEAALAGWIARPAIYNRGLSAPEMLALYQRAGVPLPAELGARMAALNTDAFTSTGGTAYPGFSGATASGYHAEATNGDYIARMGNTFPCRKGQRFRITFDLGGTLGGSPAGLFIVFAPDADGYTGGVNSSAPAPGAKSIEVTANRTLEAAFIALITNAGAPASYTISNFKVIPLGALAAIDDADRDGGFMLRDLGGGGHHLLLPPSGVARGRPGSRFIVRGTRATSGFLLGDRPILPLLYANLRITARLLDQALPGPTITIGVGASAPNVRVGSTTLNGAGTNGGITTLAVADSYYANTTAYDITHRVYIHFANNPAAAEVEFFVSGDVLTP